MDALSREALLDLIDFLTIGLPAGGSRRSGPLSPLRAIFMPVLGPLDLIRSPIRNGVGLSEEDKDALATVRAIMELIADEASSKPGSGRTWAEALAQDPRMSLRNSVAVGQELASLVGEIAPGPRQRSHQRRHQAAPEDPGQAHGARGDRDRQVIRLMPWVMAKE